MTYAELKAAVLEDLGTDGTRRGIEAMRLRKIREACVDLQRFIRGYREGHTTRYTESDLEEKGYAHLGTLPAQAKPKAFYIICAPGSDVPQTPAVSNEVTSWATLAALATTDTAVPFTMIWVDSTTLAFRVTQLRAGTDATSEADGIKRPDDYSASNQKVWYAS